MTNQNDDQNIRQSVRKESHILNDQEFERGIMVLDPRCQDPGLYRPRYRPLYNVPCSLVTEPQPGKGNEDAFFRGRVVEAYNVPRRAWPATGKIVTEERRVPHVHENDRKEGGNQYAAVGFDGVCICVACTDG